MKKAVVLLSGGVDSAVTAAIARSQGYSLIGLTLDYGQRHRRELESARKIARFLGISKHFLLSFQLPWGGSALTDRDIAVPQDALGKEPIPVTYVPARNTIFLALAASCAEAAGAKDIFLGASAVDYSGYPDCRPEYFCAYQVLLKLGTRAGVEQPGLPFALHTPLIGMSKADIIREGIKLGLDFSLTWSCYLGGERACGRCDSCLLRLKGFREAGVKDPLEYE
jgi:7-cyano-7-deazaguanine synthase